MTTISAALLILLFAGLTVPSLDRQDWDLFVELAKTVRATGHGQWRKEAALSSKLFTAWLATLIVEPSNSMTDIRLILHPP
jgi:hypothetical protein